MPYRLGNWWVRVNGINDQGITIAELSERTGRQLYNYSADGQGKPDKAGPK